MIFLLTYFFQGLNIEGRLYGQKTYSKSLPLKISVLAAPYSLVSGTAEQVASSVAVLLDVARQFVEGRTHLIVLDNVPIHFSKKFTWLDSISNNDFALSCNKVQVLF